MPFQTRRVHRNRYLLFAEHWQAYLLKLDSMDGPGQRLHLCLPNELESFHHRVELLQPLRMGCHEVR